MRDELKYPSLEAVNSILKKLGVNPSSRYDDQDQDYEYTTCRLEELDDYIEIYTLSESTDTEKRLLGCYLLQSLEDYIAKYNKTHEKQDYVLDLLYSDIIIHETELEYWSTPMDINDESTWWHITKHLRDR